MYHQDKLIARHARCYERHRDIEDPDHPKALLQQRRNAREQKLLGRFLTLSPQAEAYYQALAERRLKKGQLVYIEGRLNHTSWTDDEDRTHHRTEIVGQTFRILSPKDDSERPEAPATDDRH